MAKAKETEIPKSAAKNKEKKGFVTIDPSSVKHRWFVVHVYSGFEKKVATAIREKAEANNIGAQFLDILVPTEDVVEVTRGRKVNTERKFFPGYVLVKMALTDESWHLVKNTPKVTGFLGGGTKPVPMSEAEAQRLITQMQEGVASPKNSISFEVGENIRVADGPFASFNGTVEEVDEEKARLKVSVSIFGRATPVDLEFSQVEKI
jgi:transcriptional antiterminator NusG